MSNIPSPPFRQYMDYLRLFVSAPRDFGTLVPSSPWLCQKMIDAAPWENVQRIAELGAGDGVLTRRILQRMRPDARLDAYEIQPILVRRLEEINDPRLRVIAHSAEKLQNRYDLIFSCLPLASLPLSTRVRILRQSYNRLNTGGYFIQFQYSPLNERLLSLYFEWQKMYEIRNFPPAWVYICTPNRAVQSLHSASRFFSDNEP